MKEFNEEYIERVRHIADTHDEVAAKHVLEELHPADIAELFKELELEEAEYLNKLLDGDKAADVLMELDEEDRRKLLSDMEPEDIARTFVDHRILTMWSRQAISWTF